MESQSTALARTASADQTKLVACALAACVSAGDVVVLEGDLGAGKTQFTQGLAAALGVTEPVCSPTFNILLEYPDGRLPLYHFDLYRLESADELEDIGFFETVEGDGVSVVEWGSAWADLLPDGYVKVVIDKVAGDDSAREISACAWGTRSKELLVAWKDALKGATSGGA